MDARGSTCSTWSLSLFFPTPAGLPVLCRLAAAAPPGGVFGTLVRQQRWFADAVHLEGVAGVAPGWGGGEKWGTHSGDWWFADLVGWYIGHCGFLLLAGWMDLGREERRI
ncbi:hypothetical protein B0T18DRAFT_406422 [Schizothecium vesticola]|uniref:Uncharacterized protein n=1 Tax=Schizothecium vesticola TaxID=314040 RepID=A0AA40F166_9PEZI|nr:hypothetical protein B0T18DRAFT_406422 [Schizothecium vesticola]